MTTAPTIDATGTPVFSVQIQALLEGLDGNGVVTGFFDELEVTDGSGDLESDIATGVALHDESFASLTSTTTVTHSSGDPSDDRWDIIVADVAAGSITLREGTAAADPQPPRLQSDEVLLAVVYVAAGATDFGSGDIVNWRVPVSSLATDDDGSEVVPDTTRYDFGDGLDVTGPGPVVTIDTDLGAGLTTSAGRIVADPGTGLTISNGQVIVAPGGVTETELLLSITPTWTGQHRFDAGVDVRADIVDDATTVWDSSAGEVPRPQVDDAKATTTVTTSSYTTSDEEVVLVDTSAIGATSTVTLASADAVDGNTIVVTDLSGAASANPITVDTEGSETIHGASSKTIDADGGALRFTSDGSNWALGGGGAGGTVASDLNKESFSADESGTVNSGNAGIMYATSVPDGGTFEVVQASLLLSDGQAAPTDLDMVIATLDNAGSATLQATAIDGDGTVQDDVTGSPVASWTNGTGSASTVALLIDNGNFNSGTGSNQDIIASARGEVV